METDKTRKTTYGVLKRFWRVALDEDEVHGPVQDEGLEVPACVGAALLRGPVVSQPYGVDDGTHPQAREPAQLGDVASALHGDGDLVASLHDLGHRPRPPHRLRLLRDNLRDGGSGLRGRTETVPGVLAAVGGVLKCMSVLVRE